MVAASALLIGSYMAVAGVLARWPWFRGNFSSRGAAPAPVSEVDAATPASRRPVNALDLALILTASFVAFAVSEQLLDRVGHKDLLILAVTVLALLAANLLPRRISGLSGDRELGTLMMYAYFGTLGFGVNVTEFGQAAVGIMVFTILAMAIHLAIILLAGRLLRADLDEILVASIAGIGGPTTAAAMAASFGRRNLIAPGILCGLLGFAIATFVGLGVYLVIPH
jgi:uncharacterized membrane protein